jgi:hypothetical protein
MHRIGLVKHFHFLQPKYILRKGMGQSMFQFTKIVEKMSKNESKINSVFKAFGHDMMAPVIAHFNEDKKIRKPSMVGQLASFLSASMRNTQMESTSKSKCYKLKILN